MSDLQVQGQDSREEQNTQWLFFFLFSFLKDIHIIQFLNFFNIAMCYFGFSIARDHLLGCVSNQIFWAEIEFTFRKWSSDPNKKEIILFHKAIMLTSPLTSVGSYAMSPVFAMTRVIDIDPTIYYYRPWGNIVLFFALPLLSHFLCTTYCHHLVNDKVSMFHGDSSNTHPNKPQICQIEIEICCFLCPKRPDGSVIESLLPTLSLTTF